MPTIIAFARFFDICIFKGHQIAKNLNNKRSKKCYARNFLSFRFNEKFPQKDEKLCNFDENLNEKQIFFIKSRQQS